jgi:hypothetical protein
MPNIRESIIQQAEENMERRKREAEDMRRKAEQGSDSPQPKRKRSQPRQRPWTGEQNMISDFTFAMPPFLVKMIVGNTLGWMVIYTVAAVIEWRPLPLEAIIALPLLIPVLIAGVFVSWVVTYIYAKFFWWITGCFWVLVSAFTAVTLITAVIILLTGRAII